MQTWLTGVATWGVEQLLTHISGDAAKHALADILGKVDTFVTSAEARLPAGPLKGLEDSAAAAFHTAAQAVIQALKA